MSRSIIVLFLILITKAEAQKASALVAAVENQQIKIADSLYALGDYTKAISLYKQLPNASVQLAKSYEALGSVFKALQNYKVALQKDPNNILATYSYGKLLYKASQTKKADSIFKILSQKNPKNSNFVYYRGLIREKENDSTAFQYYEKAYRLDENNSNALYKIAKHHIEKRRFKQAVPFIKKGLLSNQNSVRFLTLQALQYFYRKDYHNALKSYEELLKLNQSNLQLHENLAESYRMTNQFEKALEQYTVLINTYDDKKPKWHKAIARVYKGLKEYDKAIRHTEIAILLQDVPLDKEYLSLSYLFKQKGDFKKVMEMLEKAKKENPDSETIEYQLAVAADNFFKDKETVIRFYERYLSKYGETGRMRNLAKSRVSDLKKELHFSKD